MPHIAGQPAPGENQQAIWEVLVRPGKRLKPGSGAVVDFTDGEGNVAAVGKGVATITVTCGNARAEMLIVVGESTTPDPDPTPNPNPNPDPFKDSDSSAGCKGVVSTVGTITALLIAVAGAAIVRKRHE